MAYLPNIPQATDPKNTSQPQILENFSQIQTVFSVDHETFAAPNGEGKHKQVTFPVQARPAPNPAEMRMYANTGTSGVAELWLRNGDTGTNYQITTSKKNANGYTMTPAGLLIKWGSATIAGTGAGLSTFTWPATGTDIPFSTQYWAIVQVGADPGTPAKDVNAVAYVASVAIAAQVDYYIWRRNSFSTQNTNQNPFSVWVMAIGIP